MESSGADRRCGWVPEPGVCLLAATVVALELVGRHLGLAALDGAGRPYALNASASGLLPAVRGHPLLGTGDFSTRDVEVRQLPPAAPGLPVLLLLRDLARPRTRARLFGVTEQELRTLRHLDGGCTATEAARRMGLSPATVRGYIASLHRKLDAGHTAALLRRGRDLGMLGD
ncbi:helix-turn-helix transcriptional regulator [Streptomyces cinnabarinus]|uniref:Helix-turn-helix transcriptional regulator n=1 Tax=Streptomyces cinnabarinus TaxID=67287 RepID=A0ABY7KM13_9ACTN|nr:helix-turn-helix transcriptional regulator [Streptomyces cinnabarinus]WAZ23741.1 helix-turn-helix transcriptional regulator [Streptomyces cinnabarinus]